MTTAKFDLASHPLTHWTGALGLPDYAAIEEADFAPVFDAAFKAHNNEIAAIARNGEEPTIDNTLMALELAGEPLGRVSAIFWGLAGAHTNANIQELERQIAPKMSRHISAIYMDTTLFARVDRLYRDRDKLGLDGETSRVLELAWKRFIKAGAQLDDIAKQRLAEINETLAGIGAQFGQNVLTDEADWSLLLDKGEDLAGLPDFLIEAMAEAADSRGERGRYALSLSRSLVEPFLIFSQRRDLRERVFNAFTGRGRNGGKTDNSSIIGQTLQLRAEKAQLLGYDSYAALKLDDTMAKTPQAVMELLEPVWVKARERAAADRVDMQALAAASGSNDTIAAWDWRYWQEKLRAERYDFDETELKPYLQLERIIEAAFDVANRLFGLTFEERPGISAWHSDVRIFEARHADGSHCATFLADYFNRPSKRSGAWMSMLQKGHRLGSGEAPIVCNVMNFAKPPKGQPALLSLDDARTLFHEFGHALHGMLSDVTWPSVSGTSVARDFVELPSQLFEHWLTVPEILQKHAVHYRTGAAMPKALLDKMLAARCLGAGFATVEFAASALVDMAYHGQAAAPDDPLAFEAARLAELDMPAEIAMRHASPHFLHVFAGDGYSAGYYSYMWSEVLDADAFAAFEETGDSFDPATAGKLRHFIYGAGGSRDPEELYMAFRGKMPSPQAMMEKRGLG